jgi:glycerophosphoryl diester phosphodiesterase
MAGDLTMSFNWRSPLVIAHRGASAHAPENTLSAFDAAIHLKADMIEFDTKLSADEQVVIIHDQTVDRTTDGTGYVGDLPLAALKELDASTHFPDFPHKEPIPTLEEAIKTFRGKILFNIELSNYKSPLDSLPIKVAELILHFSIVDQVLVSSFHPLPLRRFHQLLPSVPIGFLAKRGLSGFLSRSRLGKALVPYQALHPEKSDLSPNMVKSAQQSGMRVHPYVINEYDEIARLLSLGIDGIITDFPLLARQVIESNQPHS